MQMQMVAAFADDVRWHHLSKQREKSAWMINGLLREIAHATNAMQRLMHHAADVGIDAICPAFWAAAWI